MNIKKILSVSSAMAVMTMCGVNAFAAYTPVVTDVDNGVVTVDITAKDIKGTATQFTVEAAEGIKVVDFTVGNGGYFNKDTMRYAWAGVEAPADDTVMLTLVFEVSENTDGLNVSLKADAGFEDEVSTAVITITNAEDKDETEETPNETEETPNETEENPDETEEYPDETEEYPDETEEYPDETEEYPDETEEYPDETEEYPDETEDNNTTETNKDSNGNPDTGVALTVAPAMIAGVIMTIARKRK